MTPEEAKPGARTTAGQVLAVHIIDGAHVTYLRDGRGRIVRMDTDELADVSVLVDEQA